MAWKQTNKDDYRKRVNDLIEKRRSTAKGWTDYGQREQKKAEREAQAAEDEQAQGWGLPALLGGGVGMMFGGPAGAAIGAGLGGGLGLLRAGETRGGGIEGFLESLGDPVGALTPIMKNPAQALPMLSAFAPYMKGMGAAGGGGDYSAGASGYSSGADSGFGSSYGAGDYGGLDYGGGGGLSMGEGFDPQQVSFDLGDDPRFSWLKR